MDKVKIIALKESVLEDNDQNAQALQEELRAGGTCLLNLMSSPGSGKTTTLLALNRAFDGRLSWPSRRTRAMPVGGSADPAMSGSTDFREPQRPPKTDYSTYPVGSGVSALKHFRKTTAVLIAVLPSHSAFMISVRQARVLPPSSFRFHLTADTLDFG